MPMTSDKPEKSSPKPTMLLGREWFTKICAVEGISLSPQQDGILAALDKRGLMGDERQRAISDLLTRS